MTALAARWRALRTGVLWGQVSGMGVRLIDLPSRYAFHLLVAARLGVAAAGGFYIVFSLTMLAAGFGRSGVDRALARAVARAIEHGDPDGARAAIARAFRIAVVLSVATTVALLALAAPVARHVLNSPELAHPLAVGALVVLPLTIGTIAGGALAGLQRLGWSLMVYSWLWPLLFCVAAVATPLDLDRALLLVVGATTANAVAALALLYRFLPPRGDGEGAVEPLLATGLSLFSSEFVQLLLGYAPTLALGIVASDVAVGLYAVAWRLALIANLLVATVAALGAPRFAALYARGDRAALRQASAQAVGFTLVLSIVPVAAMLAAPATLLGLIGPGYADAATTLRLLMIGQGIAICCTGSAELLGMTDHAATLRRINLATLAALPVVLLPLAAVGGSAGAALATSLTIAGNALATAVAIRRHLGFVPILALFGAVRVRI
jgi:O-antigen/teichoic acid export membrane protein